MNLSVYKQRLKWSEHRLRMGESTIEKSKDWNSIGKKKKKHLKQNLKRDGTRHTVLDINIIRTIGWKMRARNRKYWNDPIDNVISVPILRDSSLFHSFVLFIFMGPKNAYSVCWVFYYASRKCPQF